ncbi:hypothetical protein HDU76_003790 [Blyttiomyces sp. JEL0837]|nr:hypothetical protein HDU76_003790 [Blyttiomyces sp. JEL0837]
MIYRRSRELKKAGQPLSTLLPMFIRKLIDKRREKRERARIESEMEFDHVELIHNESNDAELRVTFGGGGKWKNGNNAINTSPTNTIATGKSRSRSISSSTSTSTVTAIQALHHQHTQGSFVPDSNLLVPAFRKGFNGKENLRMDFEFKDLALRLPTGKSVLQGVTGEIKAGRMTAVMGPSGAGKTTFMNVLMGKVTRTGGELKINGVTAEMDAYKKIIGYVPQEDVMLRELTVREVILYSARARLPSSWTHKEIEEHADNVIHALNLTHVAHTPIGDELTRGVSGGQRKRVNIGMELAAVPLAVFLDEPTSGLDATSALDVAEILKSISRLGLTIVSVIHQPRVEIFDRFDDVLLIAPGGKTAYLGPVTKAQIYFEALGFHFEPDANRADILMDILAGRGILKQGFNGPLLTPDGIVEIWKRRDPKFFEMAGGNNGAFRSVTNAAYQPPPPPMPLTMPPQSPFTKSPSRESFMAFSGGGSVNVVENKDNNGIVEMKDVVRHRGATFLTQLWISHNRSLIQQARFLNSLWLELGVALLAGGIMGFAASAEESYKGVFEKPYTPLSSSPDDWFVGMYGMLIGIALALASAPSGVKVFGEEKSVYFREAAAGHSKLAYYIGKSISVLYRVCFTSLHFTALYYTLARPPIDLGIQYSLLFFNFYFIYGIAAVVSMLVSRQDAPLLSVIIGLVSGVLCGFGPTITTANKSFLIILFDIGANRWAAEAQYGLWIDRYRGIYTLQGAANSFGYTLGQTERNLAIMAGIGTAYRVIAFGLMVLMNRDKQR